MNDIFPKYAQETRSLTTSLPLLSHQSNGNSGTETASVPSRSQLILPSVQPSAANNGVDSPHVVVSETSPLLPPSRESMNKRQMFWEELPILARPVFGTQALEYSVVTAPTVSIGHLSTKALAAIALGSMTASVSGFIIIQGLSSALDTVLPSAWTSSHPYLVGLWAQRMAVVAAISLVVSSIAHNIFNSSRLHQPTCIIWFNSESILLLLKQDPEVAALAALYLRWVSLGLPAYAFNNISRRYFQSQGLFSIPTRIMLIVIPINAFLDCILVWGPKPIKLAFIGTPIATAISFNLVSSLFIIWAVFFVPKTAWCPISGKMFTGLGALVRLGISGVGQVASEWWTWELVALGASLLGPVALATQSVLLVSTTTTYQAPYALGVAASVRIGNLLGEHKPKRAAVSALVLALGVAAFTSAMFVAFRKSWAHIFNDDPRVAAFTRLKIEDILAEVVSITASILPLCALFQFFDAGATVTGGILRAQGKQLTGAFLNCSAYYMIGIPFGILLAFKYNLKLHGIWTGLAMSLFYCAVLGLWLAVMRADWDWEVEKVKKRIEAERERDRKAGEFIEEGVKSRRVHDRELGHVKDIR
ncbi:hypothetical protein AN958_07251 [Leucoagaricus sp. SymC.cos]|nr:hypothetical protein AN958_07251 [Leucoagaricus sp. SymC.cos]